MEFQQKAELEAPEHILCGAWRGLQGAIIGILNCCQL